MQDVIRSQEQRQAVQLPRQVDDVKHFDEEEEKVQIVAVMPAHANVLFGLLTTSLLRVVMRDAHESADVGEDDDVDDDVDVVVCFFLV